MKPLFRPLLLGALSSKLVGLTLWFTGLHHAALVFFFGPDPFVLHAVLAPSSQGLVRVFTRFASDRPAVWLTIDDGPDEHDTPGILDVLDRYGARATFFVIGAHAARWPHLVQEITRRGHQIGHHTHTHPTRTFWYANSRRVGVELDQTLDVLEELGVRPQLFRPPVGIKPLFLGHALSSRGLHCVGWSLRSGDCRTKSPERFVAAITPQLRPGAIILLHEGPGVHTAMRVKGITLLLDAITRRGLTCEIPALHELR